MRRRGPAVLVASVVLAVLAAACALDPSPSPTPSTSSNAASAPAATRGSVASSAPPNPSSSSGSSLPVAAPDASLIAAVLGPEQSGLTFQYDAETTGRVAADPGLVRDATALGIGLYTVTGQDPVADYAIVSVLRLRDPGSANDDWFRTYRDSYDESACAAAGGVARHAQSEIGSHTVFIGSCAGGAFTYHLRTKSDDLVVSITGVGPGRLGERLAAAVSDP
jgi:hypothetical protein